MAGPLHFEPPSVLEYFATLVADDASLPVVEAARQGASGDLRGVKVGVVKELHSDSYQSGVLSSFDAAVAVLYFGTSIEVVLTASAAGLVASLPIALVMAASIVQITLMQETGAVARVVALMKTIAPGQQTVQIMIINLGFGTLLAAMGATPVSILPPIMLALGYSSFVSIAIPALGYDALCTYALLGVSAAAAWVAVRSAAAFASVAALATCTRPASGPPTK